MPIAIKAENLSKAYQIGEIGTGTISRDLERWYAKARGKEDPFLKIGETNDRTVKSTTDVVWSLKDISFEIEQGDAVGIIGKNGAGKSTLLKILSRVTSPTTGKVTGNGRIASLLEVGTGFHPDLTGRENVYLNGAILGMRKKEIMRKFDAIVNFAGVERYIDTPVKRYSSGMYVRLAFAVAAHLESEILIVDEVLAVGDAEFQKKCLGKMGEVSKGEGRTVLFVSHNMNSVLNLCNNSIFLENGSIKDTGVAQQVITNYLLLESTSNIFYKEFIQEKSIQVIKAEVTDFNATCVNLQISILSKLEAKISIDIRLKDGLINPFGFYSFGALNPEHLLTVLPGNNFFKFSISTKDFAIGSYWISIDITNPAIEYYDRNEDVLFIEIVKSKGKFEDKELQQSWNYGSLILPIQLIS